MTYIINKHYDHPTLLSNSMRRGLIQNNDQYLDSNEISFSLHRYLTDSSSSSMISVVNPEKLDLSSYNLPKLWEIDTLYGGRDEVVLGYEECAELNAIHEVSMSIEPIGLFGSNLGLLESLFDANCELSKGTQQFQHTTAKLWRNKNGKQTSIPVIIVQDPIHFMNYLCHHDEKILTWNKAQDRCPNIILNSYDIGFYANNTVDIQVKWNDKQAISYNSLIDLWNDYYKEWHQMIQKKQVKILMIRMEDLLFQAQQVITRVCSCAGGNMKKDFTPNKLSTKLKSINDTVINAMIQFGTFDARDKITSHYEEEELEYVKKILKEGNLLDSFGYYNDFLNDGVSLLLGRRRPLGLFHYSFIE